MQIDKVFSSALKRTLRASGSGVSIAAAACFQQKNSVKSHTAAGLLGRNTERKMHSKVVSEYPPSLSIWRWRGGAMGMGRQGDGNHKINGY